MTPKQQELSEQLTNLQRLTVLGVVEGKSQRQAYYDAGGKAKNDVTADACATEILSYPLVRAFYDSLISDVADRVKITLKEHLTRLKDLSDAALADGKFAAAVAAEIARGKASGLYVEKVANTDADGNYVQALPTRIELVAPSEDEAEE